VRILNLLFFCCLANLALCQESPEKINEVFKAYNSANRVQDSLDSYNFQKEELAFRTTFRERLISQSGNSGLASVLVSLGTGIGSVALLAQGETQASYVVSIAGQTLSTILLARAFILLTKAGNELAEDRLVREGIRQN
jgi:hypothetical protein